MKIESILKDWYNLKPIRKINIFLGFGLFFFSIIVPNRIDMNLITALVGLLVARIESQDKLDPHPEYQKRLSGYNE